MKPFSLVFMGTPPFAVPTLQALQKAGHFIQAVYSQPPRPAGRGHQLKPSPVQAYAETQGWVIKTPKSLRTPQAYEELRALKPEVIVVAAYGLLLPQAILDIPPLGCLNVHGSLLPRWRGAAPLQRALLAGDEETGITIMQMEAGLDTGPMLLKDQVSLSSPTTFASLHDILAYKGASLLVQALEDLRAGTLIAQPQPEEGITYAAKILKEEGLLDWTLSAQELDRHVRALTPWPGTWFIHEGHRIKILKSQFFSQTPQQEKPGKILDGNLTIQCGQGALRPLLLQKAGGSPLLTQDFLRGYPLPWGTILPCPATN
jgi:methionyl-tRNA formyltransferase